MATLGWGGMGGHTGERRYGQSWWGEWKGMADHVGKGEGMGGHGDEKEGMGDNVW